MPPAVFNAVLSIVGMLVASNVCAAFGINTAPDFLVTAAITSTALALPMPSSTVAFLVTAAVADLVMSGPPGVIMMLAVIMFMVVRLLTSRFQPQRLISIALVAATVTAAFHALQAAVFALMFRNSPIWKIYFLHDWKFILATACLAPFMTWLTNRLADAFSRQKKNKLI